jgi:hypothetical protein
VRFAGQGGEGCCYFGQPGADVGGHGGHGPCPPAAVFVACVGLGDGEAELAFDPGQYGVPSLRTRRVQRICVAILPGRFACGTFALIVTRRVAIPGLACDARHIVRSWHDLRDAGRSRGGRLGRRG